MTHIGQGAVNLSAASARGPMKNGDWLHAEAVTQAFLFKDDEIIVETAYQPDPALWEPDFKTRRKSR
ncbi:MAG: hypothetical protein ACR2KK_21860 [Acidimicrobiales bacterium]